MHLFTRDSQERDVRAALEHPNVRRPHIYSSLRDLADRIHDAYREACEAGECDCVTTEEHERMLASGKKGSHANS